MELWIRSQDKLNLIKIENVSIDDGNSILGNLISDDNKSICDYWRLGTYKTKERASEVLDEIQRILQPMIKAYTPLTESKEDYKNHCMKTELVGYETTYDIVALPTYVYEMPKE